MSVPGQYDPQPPRQDRGPNTILIVMLVGLGILSLACCGLCGGCVVVTRQVGQEVGKGLKGAIEQSRLFSAIGQAQDAVRNHPQVIERLGEPLEFLPGDDPPLRRPLEARETFQFDVRGPQGTAIVSVVATPAENVPSSPYRAATISVTFPDGTVIHVPHPPGSDAAPPPAEAPEGRSAADK